MACRMGDAGGAIGAGGAGDEVSGRECCVCVFFRPGREKQAGASDAMEGGWCPLYEKNKIQCTGCATAAAVAPGGGAAHVTASLRAAAESEDAGERSRKRRRPATVETSGGSAGVAREGMRRGRADGRYGGRASWRTGVIVDRRLVGRWYRRLLAHCCLPIPQSVTKRAIPSRRCHCTRPHSFQRHGEQLPLPAVLVLHCQTLSTCKHACKHM